MWHSFLIELLNLEILRSVTFESVFLFLSLGFSIVPDSNWILEVGKEYAVSVQLFDKDGHKIYMSDVSICRNLSKK